MYQNDFSKLNYCLTNKLLRNFYQNILIKQQFRKLSARRKKHEANRTMEHHFPALMQHHLGGYSIGGHDCGKQHECAEHTEHHQQEPDTTGQGLSAGAAGERNRRWHVGQYGLG